MQLGHAAGRDGTTAVCLSELFSWNLYAYGIFALRLAQIYVHRSKIPAAQLDNWYGEFLESIEPSMVKQIPFCEAVQRSSPVESSIHSMWSDNGLTACGPIGQQQPLF
ncbi:hypothetical protein JHK82_016437 [Glycine max]|nr:hypothetical protein JHK85_016851 [Glycine max]KAG5149556.1 hypothetical protein JHK82_016437 [Glycine max]